MMPINAGKIVLPEVQPVWAVQFLEYSQVLDVLQKVRERFTADVEAIPFQSGAYRIVIEMPNQEKPVTMERGSLLVQSESRTVTMLFCNSQEDGSLTMYQYNTGPNPDSIYVP